MFRLNPSRNPYITNWNLKEARLAILETDIAADNPTFPIFFWSNKKFSMLSNFALTPFSRDGRDWQTVEHYFQAMKSLDFDEQEQIRMAPHPRDAKNLGRQILVRPDWDSIKYDVMLNALRAKFESPALRSLLLATGERPLYDDNPYDDNWGTGKLGGVGFGQNLLGQLLMQVREEIRKLDE